jgi:putative phage-type endonuclease
MRIVTLEQRSPEWLTWRATGIGASDAAAIIGASIWTAPQELWEIKTGRRPGPSINPAMQRGIDHEDEARAAYEAKTGEMVTPLCAEHDEADFIKVSFDGVDIASTLAVEIKVPGEKAQRMAEAGQVPPYYIPQLQHQMMVGGFDLMHYWSYVPETRQGILIPVKRDEAMIEELWEAEHDFWKHVREDRPMYSPEWAEAAGLWRLANADFEEAKARREKSRAALDELMPEGFTSFKGAGVTASRWPKKGEINYEALLKELGVADAAVERFRGQGSKVFTVKKAALARKGGER